jgi:hypothetical protein
MSISKDSILQATNKGLEVFKYFLGNRFAVVGKSFKSPFYQDSKASCYVYLDKSSGIYKFKDFGNGEFSGDCFYLVAKLSGLSCDNADDFPKILNTIDYKLNLCLSEQKPATAFRQKMQQPEQKQQAVGSAIVYAPAAKQVVTTQEQISLELAKKELAQIKEPILLRAFSLPELKYWASYGIRQEVLQRLGVMHHLVK